MASPFTPEQLANMHESDSRVAEIHWLYSVPIAVAVLTTAFRFWAKHYGRNGITLDDYLILAATACLLGQCIVGLAMGPPHGMGRHVIFVSEYDKMMVRKGDYIFSHCYDIALVTVKLGILAFYYRVFVLPLFRKVVLATAAFVIAWGIGITVTLLLVCRPLEAYWDATVKGRCLEMVTFTYFTNISNLITDIWIFLMPVPVIWHLQLQTKKKLLLTLIFCIGLATCVVSSIRLTVVLGRGYPDFTWSYVPLGAYSVFEPLGGIICTNLPIIWHMLRKRKATLPSHTPKTHSSNATPTIGSRRSRLARTMGLTNRSVTQNDMTILHADGHRESGADWIRLASADVQSQKPDPNIWTSIERVHTGATDGSSNTETPLQPGMKKTVWNVRK